MNYSNALRTIKMEALVNHLGAGAKLKFYDGAKPATTATAITTQNLLATLLLDDPAGTVSDGVLTFNPIDPDLSVDLDGEIAWFSLTLADDTRTIEGTAGVAGEITIDEPNVVAGQELHCDSLTLTEGNE